MAKGLGSGAGELHALPFDTAGPVDDNDGRPGPLKNWVEVHADRATGSGVDLAVFQGNSQHGPKQSFVAGIRATAGLCWDGLIDKNFTNP